MRPLRHQHLFAIKLRLGMRTEGRSTALRIRRIEQGTLLPDSESRKNFYNALAVERVRVHTHIAEDRPKRRRRRLWFGTVSIIVNIIGAFLYYYSVVNSKLLYQKVERDSISVTFIPPEVLPEPKPRVRYIPKPIELPPPVEKEPPPIEEEPDVPPETLEEPLPEPPEVVVEEPSNEPDLPPEPPPVLTQEEPERHPADPLDVNPLRETPEDTRRRGTTSEAIAADALAPSGQTDENRRNVDTELVDTSLLESEPDRNASREKRRGQAQTLVASNLRPENTEDSPLRRGTRAALDVGQLQPGGQNPSTRRRGTGESALDTSSLKSEGEPKSSSRPRGTRKPLLEDEPLRVENKTGGRERNTNAVSKGNRKLEALPVLKTQITPKFPPVEGIQKCRVVLRLWVETDGKPSDIRFNKVTPTMDEKIANAFGDAAVTAAKNARFDPARRNGKPVRLLIEIPIWFERTRQ